MIDKWDFIFRLKHKLRGVICFFVRHDETTGDRFAYQPDYCDRCFVEWPQDRLTMPDILNRVYCWVVNRGWQWFDSLDVWLMENHNKKLPSWWEY